MTASVALTPQVAREQAMSTLTHLIGPSFDSAVALVSALLVSELDLDGYLLSRASVDFCERWCGMFQFRKEDAAIQAARTLAVRQAEPVLVMVRASGDVFSVGLSTNAALLEAGRHLATVHSSGHVDYEACGRPQTHQLLFRTKGITSGSSSRCC